MSTVLYFQIVMEEAVDRLRTHRVRSILSVLGIVIGIATVIGVSSVIAGLRDRVSSQITSLGSNIIWAYRYDILTVGRPSPEMMRRQELTSDDAIALAGLPHVRAVSVSLRFAVPKLRIGYVTVKCGRSQIPNAIFEGHSASGKDVYDLTLRDGRWFVDEDEEHRENVAVIGAETADALFQNGLGLEREIKVDGGIYRVVGILERRKSLLSSGKNPEDNIVFIPYATFRKVHPEIKDHWISLKVDTEAHMPNVEDGVRGILRQRRRLRPDQVDNFALFSQDSLRALFGRLSTAMTSLMLAVSSVGLAVGGIGIMNITLISVTERTNEIGLRKAVGAFYRDILIQFFMEAVLLGAIGGSLGILLGTCVALLLPIAMPGFPCALSYTWLIASLFMSVVVGLIFGLYPAMKAARLSPIDALRCE